MTIRERNKAARNYSQRCRNYRISLLCLYIAFTVALLACLAIIAAVWMGWLLPKPEAPLAELAPAKTQTAAVVHTKAKMPELPVEAPEPEPWSIIENCTITHYCACRVCCGKEENHPAYGITASGATVEEGVTVAVDPALIPLGSTVEVNGHTYIAQDTGSGVNGGHVDIYIEDHARALELGRYETTVRWRDGL